MTQGNRPLSPHLQVYRPQITTVLSIAHRVSGFGVAVGGSLLVTWWLWSLVEGASSYTVFYNFSKSMPGQLVRFLCLWGLVYHALNGVRHLFWDAGRGIDMKNVTRSGWTVFIASMLLSALFWLTEIYY